jgi:hypothetical protein
MGTSVGFVPGKPSPLLPRGRLFACPGKSTFSLRAARHFLGQQASKLPHKFLELCIEFIGGAQHCFRGRHSLRKNSSFSKMSCEGRHYLCIHRTAVGGGKHCKMIPHPFRKPDNDLVGFSVGRRVGPLLNTRHHCNFPSAIFPLQTVWLMVGTPTPLAVKLVTPHVLGTSVALARDEHAQSKLTGSTIRKADAARKVKSFIQNIMHFRDYMAIADEQPHALAFALDD